MKGEFTVTTPPKTEMQLNFVHVTEPVAVGFYMKDLFHFEIEKLDPSTHDHQYDKNGKCACGKVLPDIRPYPQV